jgi:hypothetical protein
MKEIDTGELALMKTLLDDCIAAIPKDVKTSMLFPILWWNNHGLDDGGPFVWGVFQDNAGWAVWEYYPDSDTWGCNTDTKNRQTGLDFVREWLRRDAPVWEQLYWRKK